MTIRRSDENRWQYAARVSADSGRRRKEQQRRTAEREARRSPGVDGHPTWCVCTPCEDTRTQRGDPRIMDGEDA